jgi:UDP-glucuronate 4-epimerase
VIIKLIIGLDNSCLLKRLRGMNLNRGKVLVTGSSGFIGFHLVNRLLNMGFEVIGLDNLNDYYDVQLKRDRTTQLVSYPLFRFIKVSLEDRYELETLFANNHFDTVINLAAQAGVRYSIENPHAYVDSNIVGFVNILECCRHFKVGHLIYASSSSVYGANKKMPFSVHDSVDHPVSLYAATKKANELMAHAYSHLYGLPVTGLRFFTVYGPWGRPDMALFLFTRAILSGLPIQVFNYGRMKRDFTYIDDIIEGVVRLIGHIPEPNENWSGISLDPGSSYAPFKIYNIGNNQPTELIRFIEVLEEKIGKKAVREFLPLQSGDVPETYADVEDLMNDVGFRPHTAIEDGIGNFVDWYKKYYGVE